MQKNTENPKERNKLSAKTIAIITITIIALFVQLISLGKPHYFPIPPSLNAEMVLTQKSLNDGSTLIVDSQGKRMLFTNTAAQLVKVVEANGSESKISKILEVSTNEDGYVVHGVNEINKGAYLSSEAFIQYDKDGNYKFEISQNNFNDDEYITSVNLVFDTPPDYFYPNEQVSTLNVPFSTSFLITNLLFYLAAGWLLIIAIVLLVWAIRNKFTKKTKIGFVIAIFVIATIAFYSVSGYNQIQNNFNDNIIQATNQINAGLQNEKSVDKLTEVSKTGIRNYLSKADNEQTYNELRNYIIDICKSYGKEQGIYVALFLECSNYNGNIYIDSRDKRATGKYIEISVEDKNNIANSDISQTTHLRMSYCDTIYSSSAIKNVDGQIVAYLLVGSNTDNMVYLQGTQSFDLFIKLLAILIGIYVAITALIMCKESIKRCVHQKKQDLSQRIANLSGMYTLIYKFAYSIDSFLVVYIAASMTAGIDSAKQALIAAAPIALFYTGQWIGTLLSTPLIKKIGERNLAIISSIISIFIMLFLAWTVFCGNIILYSIGRFALGFVVSGVLYVISGTLPICAKDKEQRRLAIESSMRGSIASAIITTLIGGYTSEFAGYVYLYFIGAAMCGLLLLMTIFTFGRKNELGSQDDRSKFKKQSLRGAWAIFLRPEFLMYIIFFGIPDLLISGYSSFIFPLIAQESGMPVVLLSNLGVFSLMLMYLCQKPIDEFSRQYNSTVMLVLPSLAICAGLLCFIISPNIYWATIMMLLPGVLSYMTNVSEKEYIVETSEKYNQDATLVQSNYYTIYAGIQTGSTPALSAFMLLGLYPGCAALGAVCGVMYCIFGVYCKRKN